MLVAGHHNNAVFPKCYNAPAAAMLQNSDTC